MATCYYGDLDHDVEMMLQQIDSGFEALELEYSLDFEEWSLRLQSELEYLIDQPATPENLEKIGHTVDQFFSEGLFRHDNHDIQIERTLDNGLEITVLMDYADPQDYYVDFGINDCVDFELRFVVDDILPWEDTACLDCCDPPTGADLAAALEGIVAARNAAMARKAEEARLADQTQRDIAQSRILNAMQARVASMSDGSAPQPKTTESVEDILFAPIEPEEKKPEPAKPSTDDCYYDGD